MAAKAALVADLLRRSTHCVTYTGAGISTSSGIKDYATKATDSAAHKSSGSTNHVATDGDAALPDPYDVKPTEAHQVLSALHRGGFLAHWLQQNHDGLPQKAGLPQAVINEIHGAWFDPSNPVVPFRAELRPDLFGWMLDEELRADLVIAAGTSLCDTPSTADRVVIAAARRAEDDPRSSLGAVIVGLQRTRLDHVAQLRVYGLTDTFFTLIAKELWGSPWQQKAPPPVPAMRPSAAARSALGDSVETLQPGQLLYVAAGPPAGRAARIAACLPSGHISLDYGPVLGSWWLEATPHPAAFPVSSTASKRPSRFRRVMEATMRVEAMRAMPGPPQSFLSGVWEGDAVLISQDRSEHPTAPAERAQHLRWVLGGGRGNGEICGAGFTTWPAAHVMLDTRGRVWHTLRGEYKPEEGHIELIAEWEAVPGSRHLPDGLGPGQGEAVHQRTRLTGRVWWDDRCSELCFGGTWLDCKGVQGAFLLVHQDPVGRKLSRSGSWTGNADLRPHHWVLAVEPDMVPGAFGAVTDEDASEHSNGLSLLRGIVKNAGVLLCKSNLDGTSTSEVELEDHGSTLRATRADLEMHFCQHYTQMQLSDLLGVFRNAAGGAIEITQAAQEGPLAIKHPALKQVEHVRAETVCVDGAARLFKQLGRWVPESGGRIEWSSGSVWTRG